MKTIEERFASLDVKIKKVMTDEEIGIEGLKIWNDGTIHVSDRSKRIDNLIT